MPKEFQVFHESHLNPVVSVILPDNLKYEDRSEIERQAVDLAASTLVMVGIHVEGPRDENGFDTQTVDAIESPFVQEHLFFNNIKSAISTIRKLRTRGQAA